MLQLQVIFKQYLCQMFILYHHLLECFMHCRENYVNIMFQKNIYIPLIYSRLKDRYVFGQSLLPLSVEIILNIEGHFVNQYNLYIGV